MSDIPEGSLQRRVALAEQRDDAFATLALLASAVSAVIALVYWVARAGFDNPVLPVLKALALSLCMTTAPFTIRFAFRMNARPYRWFNSYSFLWLATLIVTAALGWLVPIAGLNAFYLLASLGIAGFVLVSARSFGGRSLREALLLPLGAALFAQWIAGVVWGRIYKNPLFFENLAATGIVHHDALFLTSLGNMLRTYGVASTGLNGLPYIPYHWGSSWLFVQWANLLDSSLLDFYQLGYAVTIIPLFFGAVLGLSSEVSHSNTQPGGVRSFRGLWFWGLFLAATIGVVPIEAMDALGVWTSNLVISESYAVSVAVALLLAGVAVVFWRGGAATRLASGDRFTTVDNGFLLVVMPVGIALLGYLKISLMLLGFGVAIYLAMRVRLLTRRTGVAATLLATVLVVVTYRIVSLPAHNEGVVLLDFLRDYVPRTWWAFFPLLHLFWSWLYIAVRLIQERISTLDQLWAQVKARRLLDVEAVLFIALLGVAPALLLHIDGGSAFYFSDVQRWFSLALLIAMPSLGTFAFVGSRSAQNISAPDASVPAGDTRRTGSIRLTHIAVAILALPLVATMAFNSVYWTKRFAQASAATRLSLYPASRQSSIPAGIHGLPYLTNSDLLREGLQTSRNFRVVDGLRTLSSISLAERRRTALFIPQSERAYWEVLTRPGACSFASLVAPALSAMAMIDGMPPFGCKLSPFYGLGQYTPRRRPQSDADASMGNVCRKARASGFDGVLRLHFDASGTMTTTTVECGSSGNLRASVR